MHLSFAFPWEIGDFMELVLKKMKPLGWGGMGDYIYHGPARGENGMLVHGCSC